MAGAIQHPLKHNVDEILTRSIPEEERDDLRRLLDNIVLYIKRVETGALTSEENLYPDHPKIRFSEITPSTEIAESLKDRLRIIQDYNIRSVSRIQEILLFGLERTPNRFFTDEEVILLHQLAKDPMASVSHLARSMNKSRFRVHRLVHRLEEENGLRRLYLENRGKLKLSSVSCVFRTHSYEKSKALESWARRTSLPFLTALVFDVTYSHGFISLAIPSQQRAHNLFEQRVKWLEQNFLQHIHIHRIQEMYWNIRFDLYDSQLGRWQIPPELNDVSRIEDPGETGLYSIARNYYADLRNAVQFRQIDFLLANLAITPRHSLADIKKIVSNWGFSYSKNSLWLHLKRLKEEQVISPMMYFSGGGFEEFVLLSILCTPSTRRRLQWLASFFPAAFTYPSQEGISIFIKRPVGWRDTITTIIREISESYDIQDLITVHQERNIGSRLSQGVFRRWNDHRQYWEFTDEEI